jgi:sigma-B regulation protein RsbU (phosphoserine phosphatase)
VFETLLLDIDAQKPFDDLTRLAATLVGAPLAFATIVDDRHAFWKSTYGLPEGAPRQNTVEESFCQYVVRSRGELIVTDAAVDPRTHENPSVETVGVRAWAGFPLLSPGGEVLGSFCVVDTAPRSWSERDIEILRTLAHSASHEIALCSAVAAERTARSRAEALATTLQESLLPPALPNVPGLEVAARFHPAGTGIELVGDFYDLFESRGGWSFVVGDVCGKGIEAAKAASLARYTVGAGAMQQSDPAGVMEFLNETFSARRRSPDLFLTAVYGTLRVGARDCTVRLVSAGHVAPIVLRANGKVASVDLAGPLIGVFPTLEIEGTTVRLGAGDALIVFTDGVTEARRDGELFGEERVRWAVAAASPQSDAEGLARCVERAALSFGGNRASDDIAVLVLRVPR